MLRSLIFLSLWTLVHGVVLAVVTTTVTGDVSAAITSFPKQTIPQSACIFTSTLDISSDPVSVCECSSTILAGINLAVSGSSTTSYCALGGPLPTGYTQIPAIDGQPLPALLGNNTLCASSSATESGRARFDSNGSITSATSTSKRPFTILTGTPKPSATTAKTGSGAFKNGAAMCYGLLATTLVAVFLL